METKIADTKRFNVAWFWWLTVFAIGALVLTASVLSILNKLHGSDSTELPTHPASVVQNYATALELAVQFFDVQKCNVPRILYS